VFAVATNGLFFTNLYSFTGGDDGATPLAGLTLTNGTLYGTASEAGSNFLGTVFAISTTGSQFTNLYAFTGVDDGAVPEAGLILSGNTLYGTTLSGGSTGYGTVFAINTDGSGFTNLYGFTGGDDGANPAAGLIVAGNTLYGTAVNGGATNNGTVFAINTDGSGFTTLHSFSGLDSNVHNSDGVNPQAGLVLSGNTVFGTAEFGGMNYGTVFAINTNGASFSTLLTFNLNFNGFIFQGNDDGATPQGGMVLSGHTLYGTASDGGNGGGGTVYSIQDNGSNFTTLYNFTGGNDGAFPVAGLILSGNTLYGAAEHNGSGQSGVLFSIGTNGSNFTVIYSFSQTSLNFSNADGAFPAANLLLSGNRLYGTAQFGGDSGSGTIFAVNSDGSAFTNLHSFTARNNGTNSDGAGPIAGLILATNVLYGVAQNGGGNAAGTVFAIHTDGSGFTNLYNFAGGSDGANPMAPLFLSNNVLYGTAPNGGSGGNGTLFTINVDGSGFTNIYRFNGFGDGFHPISGLLGDAVFCSTENSIVQIGLDGQNMVSTPFPPLDGQPAWPITDGTSFYGVSPFGSLPVSPQGEIWKMAQPCLVQNILLLSPTTGQGPLIPSGGTYSTQQPLNSQYNMDLRLGATAPGHMPSSIVMTGGGLPPGLFESKDGNTGESSIRGTFTQSGVYTSTFLVEDGCDYAVSLRFIVCQPPTITSIASVNGTGARINPGDAVTVNGSGFTNGTSVMFNGGSLSGVTVLGNNQLRGAVPAGAKTGFVTVDNGCSSFTSAIPCIIGPPPAFQLQTPVLQGRILNLDVAFLPGEEITGIPLIVEVSPDMKTWSTWETITPQNFPAQIGVSLGAPVFVRVLLPMLNQ
jgi:uncharacterized repeat protein (TIGR03803 family)